MTKLPDWVWNINDNYSTYDLRWEAVKKKCQDTDGTWKCPFCAANHFGSYNELDFHMRLGSHYDLYKTMNNIFYDIIDEEICLELCYACESFDFNHKCRRFKNGKKGKNKESM